jgi:hypothetical protein
MSHVRKAVKNFKKFHGRTVEKQTSLQFSMPKALTFLGDGHAIEYKSDKKLSGKQRSKRLFRHFFGRGVKIYLHPNQKWILIGGGKFRVTDWMRD